MGSNVGPPVIPVQGRLRDPMQAWVQDMLRSQADLDPDGSDCCNQVLVKLHTFLESHSRSLH